MTLTPLLSLEEWGEAQLRISAMRMAECVSATGLVKHRAAFGQTVRPALGSVVAATGSSASEDEPDYFFHWLRDSAAVMRAGLALIRCGIDADGWRQRFADFVRFSLDLGRIDGTRFLTETPDLSERTAPEARQYLRGGDEIGVVKGERVLGEVRYNADGTLDFLRWNRPQHDGPAARAAVCMRYLEAGAVPDEARADTEALLRLDLDYTMNHAGEPCYDIWEEEFGWHFYTLLLQLDSLRYGADWAVRWKDLPLSWSYDDARHRIENRLEDFDALKLGIFPSQLTPDGKAALKQLDFSVILGFLHRIHDYGRRTVWDTRTEKTMNALGEIFAGDYAINNAAGKAQGLAFGRYAGDSYVSGGAWFICTFGAAEFHYRHAVARLRPKGIVLSSERIAFSKAQIAKGDAIMQMARRFIPASGDISEQFDRTTGAQTSAKNLAWSHSAFITAWRARKDALLEFSGALGDSQ
ncbi:MAG: glucan 1,4-alpha-glucosidase [Rhodomicrobium sp.]|nr:glucan 1,4-alpha-glucosidase [Rhodomicrobium sp.]